MLMIYGVPIAGILKLNAQSKNEDEIILDQAEDLVKEIEELREEYNSKIHQLREEYGPKINKCLSELYKLISVCEGV